MLSVQSRGLAAGGLPIRRLSAGDLAGCVELAADRGWPPERNKWRLLFAVGEVYGIDDPAGGLAAMVVLTRYGRRLASVGMLVVAARFGRRGLGRRVMTHLLEQAGPAVVHLAATSDGRPLFQSLGFRAVGTVSRHAGRFVPQLGAMLPSAVRSASMSDVEPMATLDLLVFRRRSPPGADGAVRLRRAGRGRRGRPGNAGRVRHHLAQ